MILGASFDDVAKNRAFADKLCYPFRLLSDPDRSALGAPYDAIDPEDSAWPRRISYLIGPDRRVVKAYAKVDPSRHAAEVLADVP